MYIPDNNDAYIQYERQRDRDQHYNDKLGEIAAALDDAMSLCLDYDTEDNADLCNRLEKIYELLDKQAISL
uniref:hypothetical protein n=1 Tax=Anaerotaenia torta TaxID=433293 RepID=UPI003D1FC1B9